MATLNINTDALVAFTNRLEKLHRSDLPIAIRNTLTKAAFLTKKESLLKIVKSTFVNRNKTFFRSKSRFKAAQGFNVNQMKATIGMVDIRRGGGDHAVRDLEEQEHGGTIGGRSFIPTDKARVGGNNSRNVSPRNRIGRINLSNVIRTRRSKGQGRSQKFVKAAILAKNKFGNRAFILTRKMLFRIDSLKIGKKLSLKVTPLYSFVKARNVKVEATGFMRRSSMIQANKLDIFYKNEAEKRIKKAKL